MPSCREVSEHAVALIEDSLDLVARRDIEEHLHLCSGCRRYVDQIGHVLGALKALPAEGPTSEVERLLLDKMMAAQRDKPG